MDNIEKLITTIEKTTERVISLDGIKEKLKSGKKLKIKFGADPSRPDLHLGHYVPIKLLKLFQDMGHEIIFLIGDFTAMIGDPSGRSKTRPSLTADQARNNAKTYLDQVNRMLDISKTTVVFNSEWLSKMTLEDVIKLGSNYTVARILERDDFSKRYKEGLPIGIHELMYPLMQGYDSVALNADIEVGGTDQLFNLLVGRELQKSYNQTPQDVLTTPLLIGLDGKEKMSKSFDNYIGVSDPAEIMFEKCMRVPDALLENYFSLTTSEDEDTTKQLILSNPREAHFKYARIITTQFHSEVECQKAEERYHEVSKGAIPTNIETIEVNGTKHSLIDLITLAKLSTSNSEARRLISGGAIKVNGVPTTEIFTQLEIEKEVVISKGKNKFVKFVVL